MYVPFYPLDYGGADGHKIILVNNLSSRDPMYEELKDFLRTDQTDKREYILNEY